MWKKMKNEEGALVVEASIVFPIMFLVIFFMIFVGNAYLQKCRVEAIVVNSVIDAAAQCADPILKDVQSGSIPGYNEVSLKPYRYLIGGMSDIEAAAETNTQDKISNMSTGLFNNMKPELSDCDIKFNNAYIYSTVSADVSYKIMVPVRLLGNDDFMKLGFATHVEKSVADVPEFIRNVDMAEDIVEKCTGSDFADKISTMVEHLNDLFHVFPEDGGG